MRLRLFSVAVASAALRPYMSVASRTSPPVAKRVPHKVSFGRVQGENRGKDAMEPPIILNDDLFWLRDDTRKDAEILEFQGARDELNERLDACEAVRIKLAYQIA